MENNKIFKYSITFSGVSFNPDTIEDNIIGEYKIMDKGINAEDGYITFWHPKSFTIDYNLENYERWFIDFIELNFNTFSLYGITNIEIFLEIYSTFHEINFEISSIFLDKIKKYPISFPVSTYVLEQNYFDEWINEIKK